jgi:hypothetical protein
MRPVPRTFSPQTGIRLDALRRWALYGLLASLVVSGAVWLFVHLRRADDALPSPLEPWLMKLHGGAALLTIYLAGTMLYGHMLNAWQRRRNRGSGGTAAAAMLMLALTGYGLYYFGGDALRRGTEWLHWIFGFAVPLLLWWHIHRGRRWIAGDSPPNE